MGVCGIIGCLAVKYDLDLDLANSCLLITMALLVVVLPVLLFIVQSF